MNSSISFIISLHYATPTPSIAVTVTIVGIKAIQAGLSTKQKKYSKY